MTKSALKKHLPSQEVLDPTVKVIELGETTRSAWEAFIFFGAGRVDEFKELARKAKENGFDSGYAMLLGQARIEGDKEAFEDLAVEYAVQYGQSPPAWYESHTRQLNPTRAAFEFQIESLSEDTILEVTVKLESPWPLILDLKKVQRADASGIEMFNESLGLRTARGGQTTLTNGEKLVSRIAEKVNTSPVKGSSSLWEFCFTYWKFNGLQDAFAQAAEAFVRLGGQAPVWEDLSEDKGTSADGKVVQGYKAPEYLSGMTAEAAKLFLETPQGSRALSSATLSIDMASTRHASLSDATTVMNCFKVFTDQKIKVSLTNVNEILAAMLRSLAIDRAVESVAAPGLVL